MTVYKRKKMCSECPFRAKAMNGWLGPWTVKDFEAMIHTTEDHFVCHTDIDKLKENGCTDEQIEEEGQHCVGMLRYMTSVARRSRDPERLAAQKALESTKDQAIIPPFKFGEHHRKTPNAKKG